MATETTQTKAALSNEDYSKAMNFIGQSLLSNLSQNAEQLPPELRNIKVISQALSAFLANVIYKQFPDHADSRQQMLDELIELVNMQLNHISQPH
jgi:hypothetical protein